MSTAIALDRPPRARALAAAPALLGAAAAAPIAVYLWIALHRVGYPYELDWMEGGSVELAARVLAGHSLYVAPSLAYVGWTYPPLYYWISAGVADLIGIGFEPLRLVSLAASIVSMATLAWIVIRETGDRLAGLLAAGLFAATFRISGAWFDVGRVDSLFLAFTLVALACGRWARGVRGGALVGLLAFLAFFTKQSGLLAVLPALGYLVLVRRRAGVAAVATLLALLVVSTVALDTASDGWYRYYVFSELTQQPWAHQVWLGFWRDDVLGQVWPLVALIGLGGAAALARSRQLRDGAALYWAAAALGLIGSAWVSRLHTGGYANVLMPAYAALALLAGLAYASLRRRHPRPLAQAALAAVLLLQLGLLVYPIGAQIPSAADRRAGAQLIAALRALPGPVVVFRHPWYGTVAAKGSFAQAEGIGDVLRSAGGGRVAKALRASLADALDTDHVRAVVLDGTFDAPVFGQALAREFRLEPTPITRSRLWPLTDVRTAPVLVYLRRSPPQ